MNLRLLPRRLSDEAAFASVHCAMVAGSFVFGLGFDAGMSLSAYLAELEAYRRGIGLPAGFVPASFLVAGVGGEIVGRTSIRHELNDFLAHEGGHIGFGVVAEHCRRGYATEILGQSLVIARAIGVDPLLVTCDDDNVGSAAVIERCGGVFDSLVVSEESAQPTRRYWIP